MVEWHDIDSSRFRGNTRKELKDRLNHLRYMNNLRRGIREFKEIDLLSLMETITSELKKRNERDVK